MDTVKKVKDSPWEKILENGSDKYPEYIKNSCNLTVIKRKTSFKMVKEFIWMSSPRRHANGQ